MSIQNNHASLPVTLSYRLRGFVKFGHATFQHLKRTALDFPIGLHLDRLFPMILLIDPHGTLYADLIRWVAALGIQNIRNIHLLEPSDRNVMFGFNPLRRDQTIDPAVRVDAMVLACAQVWAGRIHRQRRF